ncbi:hypothetical protein ABW19_dt0208520 [Dactylella cylindrospora]|nr:hypothetical protein ABW19_dt0208520 [Dactylella cylindrospora]
MGIKGKRQRRQQRQQLLQQQQISADEELVIPTCSTSDEAETSLEASSEEELSFPSASSSSTSISSQPSPPPSPPSPASKETAKAKGKGKAKVEKEADDEEEEEKGKEMPQPFRHLLLCSIGNPGSLLNTRHSAAHMLMPLLATSPFSQSRSYGGPIATGPSSGLYSTTLFQSPAFMNVSGPAISKAWKEFTSSLPSHDRPNSLLVVLHDDLEKASGVVKYKKDGSANGHNGLSSIKQSLPGQTVYKIGLGIGRPKSRDSFMVAEYVLQKMSGTERRKLETKGLADVLEFVRKIGEGELK